MSKRMNYCPNCSHKLEGDEKFCAACGEQVVVVSAATNIEPSRGKTDFVEALIAFRKPMEGATELTKGQISLFFKLAREKFKSGELSLDDYRKVTDGLVFKDERGERWTIGTKSGGWYRRNGSNWIAEEPDGMLEFHHKSKPPLKKTRVFCLQCGASLKPEAKFCNKCGVPRN